MSYRPMTVTSHWLCIAINKAPDNNDVNIMNLIIVMSLFVIMVWLINDTPDNLMADTTVSARVE